jgi:hypothetical protein
MQRPSGMALAFALAVSGLRPAAAQSKMPRLVVDLGAGAVESNIPFDVPVMLAGKVDTSITSVTLRSWESGTHPTPDNLQLCSTVAPNEDALMWNRSRLDADSFHLVARPFEAERTYVLCFDIGHRPSTLQRDLFSTRLAARMDRELRPVSGEAVSDDQVASLCDSLLSDFDATQAVARRGSLFDCREPRENLKHLLRVAELDSEHAERDSALRAYRVSVQKLRAALDTVSKMPVLDTGQLGELARGAAVRGLAIERRPETAPGAGPWTAAALASDLAAYEPLQIVLDSLQRLVTNRPRGTRTPAVSLQDQAIARLQSTRELLHAASGSLMQVSRALRAREATIGAAAAEAARVAAEAVVLLASTSADYNTRAAWHISANVGLAAFSHIDEVSPILGLNVYTRAVNRDAPLHSLLDWRRRFSILVAVTTRSLAKNGEREDLLPSRGLLVGAGYRLTDFVQGNLGVLGLRVPDQDPVVNHTDLKTTFFVGLSLDATLHELLGAFGKALGL